MGSKKLPKINEVFGHLTTTGLSSTKEQSGRIVTTVEVTCNLCTYKDWYIFTNLKRVKAPKCRNCKGTGLKVEPKTRTKGDTNLSKSIADVSRFNQVLSFEGMEFDKLKPGDIDAFFVPSSSKFIFYEVKLKSNRPLEEKLPLGQRLSLTRIVDALTSSGKNAILIVAEHNTAKHEHILLENCIVAGTYRGTKIGWIVERSGLTAKEFTNEYMNEFENLL